MLPVPRAETGSAPADRAPPHRVGTSVRPTGAGAYPRPDRPHPSRRLPASQRCGNARWFVRSCSFDHDDAIRPVRHVRRMKWASQRIEDTVWKNCRAQWPPSANDQHLANIIAGEEEFNRRKVVEEIFNMAVVE